jgi:hypothetical protein
MYIIEGVFLYDNSYHQIGGLSLMYKLHPKSGWNSE